MFKHKTTIYWAIRALLPEHGYIPVDKSGRVSGFVVCQPENREKVCAERRAKYILTSMEHPDRLPIWC